MNFSVFEIAFVLVLAVLGLAAVLSYLFLSDYRFRKKILGSLEFILYELSFINEDAREEGQKEKNLKEAISKMEQFLSGMGAMKAKKSGFFGEKKLCFSLELAVRGVGDEVTFYAAAPKDKSRLFEKQFESLFPQGNLKLKKDDYNIFNPDGAASMSFARLSDSPLLPIRTYQELESDPLEVILNGFSKLQTKGEGAAMQLIIKPSDNSFKKWLKGAFQELGKGTPFSDIKNKSFLKDAFLSLGKQENKEKEMKKPDEEAIKAVEKKISRETFVVNFRLAASSGQKENADIIINELKSAFSQFNNPKANGFKFSDLRGSSLKNAFTEFSFRIFNDKQKIYLNSEEISSIFHFPAQFSQAPHLKVLKSKSASAPFNISKSGVMLGVNSFRGKDAEIRMETNDRRRHTYIVGQTGTGKSNLMENMAVEDIASGAGLCVIDPHGSFVDAVLSKIPKDRVDDVIYFDPANTARPFGLNMLEYDENYPEQKTFIANEVYDIFRKLWKDVPEAFGPMFEQYYRNSILLVLEDPSSGNTLLEVVRVLSDKSFRELKLSRAKNPILLSFWRDIAEKAGGDASLQNIVPYISSKFDTFLNNEIMRPILIQEKSAFKLRDIMDNGKILLINLSKGRLGDINAYLVGLIIVGKILMAALSRVDTPEENRRDFFLYLDEFQNVTTKSIAVILSEARKYRLNLVLAHQFIGQLEEEIKKAVFGNVGSKLAFRVGVEDAEFLEKEFLPVFNKSDLINIDNFNAYVKILINNETAKPFNIKIPYFGKGDEETASALKELSALKYGGPREKVEEEIRKKYQVKSDI